MKKLGIVVNPIAGMGGPLGLKGTDGWAASELISQGAVPRAIERAARTLMVASRHHPCQILTASGAMGEESVVMAGLTPKIVYRPEAAETSAIDTVLTVRALVRSGCDLVLFAGGDGTARDVSNAVGDVATALGIPAGVKIHSAAFATSPTVAGEIASAFLNGEIQSTSDAEVVDLDEAAYRSGTVSVRLYGYLKVPHRPESLQGSKVRSTSDDEALLGIGHEIAGRMTGGIHYAIGPGTTANAAPRLLGLPFTLLGVDLFVDREVVGLDLSARQLLEQTANVPTMLVVSPIGGQGHVFGRGNQQLTAELIRRVGKEGIVIVASPSKLSSMRGRPLFVDTGDVSLDHDLAGNALIVTGLRQSAIYPLAP